ncbi:MAG: glucose-6-phosphate isomerase [Rhodobacter sp.]|uniref:glycine zipper 2TM domain-containing protein n=1 Tax=Pararhodobacter sp. TaxID=2127056 RepID=UPI001D88CCCD|nr:glycine zipper 2TM domain-containing protein [Pararhodobacter sp.]MCB1345238.1 glucose-6-phosphate isomerase [Paracoccaceae bacterium]MCC0074851.1 glucose-6-phosphate isomerase [Rhodobacter sp.]HPD90851.1 glycine zipper 2TM domain-containing protein [Pararhodobacter sp.]
MKFVLVALVVASTALGGCTMTANERDAVGGLAGAAGGLLLASAFNANPNWTIVAALGGAAAGVMVARNARTGECAYSNGRGQYYTRRCR